MWVDDEVVKVWLDELAEGEQSDDAFAMDTCGNVATMIRNAQRGLDPLCSRPLWEGASETT